MDGDMYVGYKGIAFRNEKLISERDPVCEWKDGILDARCLPGLFGMLPSSESDGMGRHRAPDERCNCGIHVANNVLNAISYGSVLVLVRLAGKIIVGQWGLRGEQGQIMSIVHSNGVSDKFEIGRKMNLPVSEFPDIKMGTDTIFRMFLWLQAKIVLSDEDNLELRRAAVDTIRRFLYSIPRYYVRSTTTLRKDLYTQMLADVNTYSTKMLVGRAIKINGFGEHAGIIEKYVRRELWK